MNILHMTSQANQEKHLIHPLHQYGQENKLMDDPEIKSIIYQLGSGLRFLAFSIATNLS